MKKFILPIILITGLSAQMDFAVGGGLNLANIGGDDTKDLDPTMKIGVALGGSATFDFDLPVLIRAEVLFSQKGYKYEESEEGYSVEASIGINYLDINPLAVYTVNDQISVFAGPSLGMFLGGKTEFTVELLGESETEEEDIESDDMNGMDFGLIFGGGYNLGIVTVEARYSLGLKNAYDEDSDVKNNVIQILVSYAL